MFEKQLQQNQQLEDIRFNANKEALESFKEYLGDYTGLKESMEYLRYVANFSKEIKKEGHTFNFDSSSFISFGKIMDDFLKRNE